MPFLSPSTHALPFASGSDTSRAGAIAAQPHAGTQRDTLRRLYEQHAFGGLTDSEVSELTGWPANVVCARRNSLSVVPCGRRMGPHNVSVQVWALRREA